MKQQLDYNALYLFVTLAHYLNYRKAAKALSLSPATLSRKITQLESQLGMILFARNNRNVLMTKSGRELYDSVKPLYEEISAKLEQKQSEYIKVAGHVRVTATEVLAQLVLFPLLDTLNRQYPDISLEIIAQEDVVDLRFEHIDFAIRAGKISDEGLVARRLGEHEFAVYAREGSKNQNYLAYDDSLFLSDIKPKIILKNLSLLKNLVESGQGQAYLPTGLCEKEIESGTLVRQEDFKPLFFQYYLVYPPTNYMRPAARAVINHIIE